MFFSETKMTSLIAGKIVLVLEELRICVLINQHVLNDKNYSGHQLLFKIHGVTDIEQCNFSQKTSFADSSVDYFL